MVDIIDVPKGKKIRGSKILPPSEDLGYYEKKTNSGISITPTTQYCPSCSSTHEYNYGKIRRKWNLFHGDLNFKLSYKEDKGGNLYAQCDNPQCNFDLRMDVNSEGLITPDHSDTYSNEVYLEDVKYANGAYLIKYEEFKELLIKKRNGEHLKICLKQRIGPSVNVLILDDEVFHNASKLNMENDKISIPKRYWKNHQNKVFK
jgi:hypothetical protein